MDKDVLFETAINFISKIMSFENMVSNYSAHQDFTPSQQNILTVLYFSGPKKLSALSACTNMNLPNCSREVKKLDQDGCLAKHMSEEDKRITLITLTPKGSAVVNEILGNVKDFLTRYTENWPQKQIEACIKSMKVLEKEFLDPILPS